MELAFYKAKASHLWEKKTSLTSIASSQLYKLKQQDEKNQPNKEKTENK